VPAVLCVVYAKDTSPTELENTAPRIKSDFKPEHADLVEAEKRKRLRKERRIKRIVTVIVGYLVMAWMVYLILVTARTVTKLYDPYEILGVSRVRCVNFECGGARSCCSRCWLLVEPKDFRTDVYI
jgi:preprotein translocase subunit Sec63